MSGRVGRTCGAGGVLLLLGLLGSATAVHAAGPVPTRPAAAASPVRNAGVPGSEVTALRSEFSRTRRLAGGVIETTLSNTPLNFRDDSGRWRRIDNRLERTAAGALTTRANDVHVTIPSVASGPVEFRDGSRSLAFSLIDAPSTAVDVDGTTAAFDDVKPAADVAYEVDGRALKETLTLASPTAPSVYRFAVDAGGLSPELRPSGDVAFVDAGGRQRLGFQAPWMRDADGTLSRGARYGLERVGGRQIVVLRLDADWLASPERRFPVVVDPTVYSGWERICEIRSGARANTSQCLGALSQTSVGRDESGIVYRSLFALQDLRAVLPDYAQILDSWFAVYLNGQTPVGASQLDLHHLTRGFAGGVTWNRSDGRAGWGRTGGDYDAQTLQRVDTTTADPSDGWMAFDITQLARDLVTGAATSPNLLLKAANETSVHVDSFDAAEVKVRWHPRAGIVSQYTYERFDLGDGSTLRYNVANGNLALAANDLGWRPSDGRSPTVRYFNSLNALDGDFGGVFGLGTQGSFGSIRLEHHWLNDSYLFAGPSGMTGVFQRRADGGFSSPAGVNATLTAQPDGTFTLLWSGSGELWTFDSDLDLARTRTIDGYTVEIAWSSDRMASLTDSAGHSVTAGYDSGGRLRTLTDQDGRVHRYDYDSLDGLVSYTSPSGAQTRYTWDVLDRVTRIDLPDRTALKIAYDGTLQYPARITPVNATGVDQPATSFDGGVDWSWAERPATSRTAWFFDPNTLIVDLIQHGSDAAIATHGPIRSLHNGYTRGDAPLTVDVSAAQVPDGIQLTRLEVDGDEVDVVSAAPCDQSSCPTRARETLSYDPSSDPEGRYEYRVTTVDGDDERTDGPLWRIAIDRTAPSAPSRFAVQPLLTGPVLAWEGAADPQLADGTPGAGIDRYRLRWKVSGSGFWSEWIEYDGEAITLDLPPGGNIDVEIVAVDRAGNESAVEATTVAIPPSTP